MKNDGNIRDEKLPYIINREAEKISALSSRKIDKYQYLAVEKLILFGQSRAIEQANFTCSSLEKASKNNWGSTEKAN